ncbi:steroidogenic acute regulatory protein-like isoform X1 [Microplitis mediator]|uniref:steroidogenic acute regulatory protein-like isoform X1 n=1 Tax=Microplitis mediator TaxID=375433 RepID=UPI0025529E92|nr:steroidogenic acute regulatory protein-like isoform X1 [Microplitis mediator]
MMTEEDRQLRAAAENFLNGSLQSQRSGSYTQRSLSSINRDYIISEDLIAGTRYHGRMSSVRRFFCLLVTFDLLFTCLMWLICTTIAGENITTAFIQQVLHYNISTSLFDIIMAAVCRFTILLLFYALLHLNHWFFVALTTALTCTFLGAKAYYFNWNGVSQPGFQALLILTSFVIAWGEAWYFDSRVVPQEIQAHDWLINSIDNERAPLLRHFIDSAQSRTAESVGNFFTPMDSPNHSDTEEDQSKSVNSTISDDEFFNVIGNLPNLSQDKIEEYKKKASLLVDQSYTLLVSKEWQQLNTTEEGDIISVINRPSGKILKIEGIVNAPATVLVNSLHNNVEDVASWNKDVSVVQKIQMIDVNTDIVYQATKTYGAGFIGPRDFVTLRHRNKCGKYYMSSGISIHINLPIRKNHIRAENSIVCLAAEPINSSDSNDELQCRVTWILHLDLKGWIPQRIIDNSIASMLEKMIKSIRSYVINCHSNNLSLSSG